MSFAVPKALLAALLAALVAVLVVPAPAVASAKTAPFVRGNQTVPAYSYAGAIRESV